MNKTKNKTSKEKGVLFTIINSPFVEIDGSILNLFHVETAYPYQDGINVYFNGSTEPCHYKIPYSDFKKLIERM